MDLGNRQEMVLVMVLGDGPGNWTWEMDLIIDLMIVRGDRPVRIEV